MSHTARPRQAPGVYVSLDELAKLAPAARGIGFRSRQPLRSVLSGRRASRLRGRGLDFEELRAYQPGDDLRAIDWRVTARARAPYVRVYREEKERPVLVVVDQRASMFFGSVRDMKSVTAARAAAIVAHRVVAAGDAIGSVVFGDTGSSGLAPQRSRQQVRRILGQIERYNRALRGDAAADLAGLNRALDQVLRISTHDQLIVLVSDLAGAVSETTRRQATELRRRNELIVLWVHDPLEDALPDVGEAVLGDGRLQLPVNTSNETVRDRFVEDVRSRRARASAFALRYAVPLLPLSTAEDVLPQLRRLLGRLERPPKV
jgi:uncharacterized protein (DUF58 family)